MLAIVAAFKEEVHSYLKRGGFGLVDRDESVRFYQRKSDSRVVVAEGGAGRGGAQEVTRRVIEAYHPDFIVCAGFAGGVRRGLRPGDLFVCDRLMSIDGPTFSWQPASARELPPRDLDSEVLDGLRGDYARCSCLSVPWFVPSGSTKGWIGETLPVSIVDMESYWVSETAASLDIPHMVVRSVLDPVEQTLPAFVSRAVREGDGRKWTSALSYALRRPADLPALLRLPAQVRVASISLAEFLAREIDSNALIAVAAG